MVEDFRVKGVSSNRMRVSSITKPRIDINVQVRNTSQSFSDIYPIEL